MAEIEYVIVDTNTGEDALCVGSIPREGEEIDAWIGGCRMRRRVVRVIWRSLSGQPRKDAPQILCANVVTERI